MSFVFKRILNRYDDIFMFLSKLFDSFMHFFYWFIGLFLLSCIYLYLFVYLFHPTGFYSFVFNMKLHLEKHHLFAYGKIADPSGGLRRLNFLM